MTDLLSVAEARRRLLKRFDPAPPETIPLASAGGRVLAEDVHARFALPPFANSSMDGFAIRAEDIARAARSSPATLDVVADIPAGSEPEVEIGSGQAARIMTGAPLPRGADAVVPVEETDFNERSPGASAPDTVRIFRAVQAGGYVRPAGEDVQRGEPVLPAGRLLLPQDLGFLAMLGVPELRVYRRPRVGILSTGDELLQVGEPLRPGKIYNSNTTMLVALVEKYGGEARDLGIAGDQAGQVQELLDSAVKEGVDLILSSAGVSVGAFDFVRTVVEEHGRLAFWRVNMRPGKPFAFGEYRGAAFIGLPGNPVSAFVGFEVFVRDAILCMSGVKDAPRQVRTARLLEDVHSDGRESYLRAVVEEAPSGHTARLTGHQGSGNLRSLVRANALLVVPSGVQFVPVGEEIQYWPLDGAQI